MKTSALLIFLAAGTLAAQQNSSSVSFDRILHASQEPQNWLTYSGTTFSQRHSLLTQITPENVNKLELQWVFQARSLEKFEATPLVVNGVMYTVQPPDDVFALDAATGRIFWTYAYNPSPKSRTCCGRVNRGLAILGDTLFMGTIDAHLLAIDAKTGQVLWNTTVADVNEFYSITHAPLIVKDKVIVGTAGGDIGIGGILAAYDVHTGKEVWRFHTIAQPGDPGHETWAGDSWKHGGAAIWNTGSYDPETNLTFWGTGNGGPWMGDQRPGDNLFTSSTVALDASSGKMKGYHQYHPNDSWDWDEVPPPILVDYQHDGRTVKGLVYVARDGYLWMLERTADKINFVDGKPFVKQNVFKSLDPKTGRPDVDPARQPGIGKKADFCPSLWGGKDWPPVAYSPKTRLLYIPANENFCSTMTDV
jgi:alcohol dehydrogenase (cytochrome c)